jgi:hypothetical protein
MDLGLMQPYLFPYVGYYQLINSVDKFVVYDDVSFIKQGWINRNRILLNCKDYIFTVPLANASSNAAINKTEINYNLYSGWKGKFMKTLAQSYAKAPNYPAAAELIDSILSQNQPTISLLATDSIVSTCNYLGLKKDYVLTSTGYNNNELRAYERVIDICKKEGASRYINPIGGQELYSREVFTNVGLQLNFIKSKSVTYPQFNCAFVPWLSIIDLLMFLSKEQILEYLSAYELI